MDFAKLILRRLLLSIVKEKSSSLPLEITLIARTCPVTLFVPKHGVSICGKVVSYPWAFFLTDRREMERRLPQPRHLPVAFLRSHHGD